MHLSFIGRRNNLHQSCNVLQSLSTAKRLDRASCDKQLPRLVFWHTLAVHWLQCTACASCTYICIYMCTPCAVAMICISTLSKNEHRLLCRSALFIHTWFCYTIWCEPPARYFMTPIWDCCWICNWWSRASVDYLQYNINNHSHDHRACTHLSVLEWWFFGNKADRRSHACT